MKHFAGLSTIAILLCIISLPMTAADKYLDFKTAYVQQYKCELFLGKNNPGLGYDLANAACAQASIAMNASFYPTPGNKYDCSTLNFIQQEYIKAKGGTKAVRDDYLYKIGTDGKVLCNWLSKSGFKVTCEYKNMTVEQLKNEIKNGPVVLGLKPFYYNDGAKTVDGHYILLRGYDPNNGGFIVNDPAGNANVKGAWGGKTPGELLSYNSKIINDKTLAFVLVIRKKK